VRSLIWFVLTLGFAKATIDAMLASWLTIVIAGVAGGLAFAALGALTLRSTY
jgi:hypothetical protein